MKITGLKTFIVGNPPPRRGGRYFIFLKLITDNGIEGVGEVYTASFAPDVVVAMIEDVFQRNVEGNRPVPHRSLLAPGLHQGLFRPPRHFPCRRHVRP